MRIYTYAEHTTRAGDVCVNPEKYSRLCECLDGQDDPLPDCPECGGSGYVIDSADLVYLEGTEEALIATARENLKRHATGAGTSAYRRKTARAILEYLGAPETETEEETES